MQAADQTGCLCWTLCTTQSDNENTSIRTGPWSNGRRRLGLMNYVFMHPAQRAWFTWGTWHQDAWWEEGKQVVAVWGFWAKPARKAWGIHVGVTLRCTTYLNTAAEHAHLFMRMIFPDGCGLFLQDNALYRKARNVLDWCEEYYNEFEGLTLSLNSKWSKKE